MFKKQKLSEVNVNKFVVFLGTRGGVGTTTYAINYAYELASTGKQVLVIDLQLDYPTAYRYLGVSEKDFDDILPLVSSIKTNTQQLDRMMLATSYKNIKLLSESVRNDYGFWFDLNEAACYSLLKDCVQKFDVVVCDAGDNTMSDLFDAACQLATNMYLVTEPQIDLLINADKKKQLIKYASKQDKLFQVIQNNCITREIPKNDWEAIDYKLIHTQFFSKTLSDIGTVHKIAMKKSQVFKDRDFKSFTNFISKLCNE